MSIACFLGGIVKWGLFCGSFLQKLRMCGCGAVWFVPFPDIDVLLVSVLRVL